MQRLLIPEQMESFPDSDFVTAMAVNVGNESPLLSFNPALYVLRSGVFSVLLDDARFDLYVQDHL